MLISLFPLVSLLVKCFLMINCYRQGHLRTVEATRSISKITSTFLCNLDVQAAKISKIVDESETIRNKQLSELEKKFEECAAKEEEQFLKKVKEMLANSNARKKKLVWLLLFTLVGDFTFQTFYPCAVDKLVIAPYMFG
ncbi:hypothetical protein IEQ34_022144 [Dendrobium chrysotoxum]|uniref:Uncharacterized protein n=1 Tax=Dendrobium chrysotoxum TaxID=161865 RepID=A0AAV7FWY8_DENCH|nr:hypothetical protein IEQ34_022144 [Dendrobium chrysotoxum]